MSLFAALARAYDHLPDAPRPGYSNEKISFVIPLAADGEPGTPIDVRDHHGRKPAPVVMQVPQPPKRASGIAPGFLWDKTAYALGVGSSRRLNAEHAAFRARHAERLQGTNDEGLAALLAFLDRWDPDQFAALGWPEDLLDTNVVFALDRDWREGGRKLHERPAAIGLSRDAASTEDAASNRICLVTGVAAPPARLHPSIKGVPGAQSSGASIVSFNQPAFTSYGHEQGDNAPVSDDATFRYTTVLNAFLARGSGHRIQLADTTCVFWAEADARVARERAEGLLGALFGDSPAFDTKEGAEEIASILMRIRQGMPLVNAAPDLADGVRFHFLGLAPNVARLSIRFWLEDRFGAFVERYQRFLEELRVEPGHNGPEPALRRYLLELAPQHKPENIPPRLAGDWMQAILTGRRHPMTLLNGTLMRTRADKQVNALRAGILRAVLIRNDLLLEPEVPMALDPDNRNRGYRLGRLFAVYEHIQRAALGRNVNATIKDRYYGAASTRPGTVFPLLDKSASHHLAKLRKAKPGAQHRLESDLRAVMDTFSPDEQVFSGVLPLAEQAMFALGYHHQFSAGLPARRDAADTNADDTETHEETNP